MGVSSSPSPVCPFEWRYGSEEMRRLLSLEELVRRYLQVEKAIMVSLEAAKLAPEGCSRALDSCLESVNPPTCTPWRPL